MYREEYRQYVDLIRRRLSEKRFIHSMNVAKEAAALSERCGADPQKAYLAGLLHDVMKEEKPEIQLQTMRRSGIIIDAVTLSARPLWHAKAGAAYCRLTLGLTDEDLLNAISYHTTARAGMSPLEKALYLADYIGEDRDYEDVDEMRAQTRASVEQGLRYALTYSVTDLVRRGKAIHLDTVQAYNEAVLAAWDKQKKG